jgi:hypothetical protein
MQALSFSSNSCALIESRNYGNYGDCALMECIYLQDVSQPHHRNYGDTELRGYGDSALNFNVREQINALSP